MRLVHIFGIFTLRESPGKAGVLARLIKNRDIDLATETPSGKETVGGPRKVANAGA
jgi:hypothetical protein